MKSRYTLIKKVGIFYRKKVNTKLAILLVNFVIARDFEGSFVSNDIKNKEKKIQNEKCE